MNTRQAADAIAQMKQTVLGYSDNDNSTIDQRDGRYDGTDRAVRKDQFGKVIDSPTVAGDRGARSLVKEVNDDFLVFEHTISDLLNETPEENKKAVIVGFVVDVNKLLTNEHLSSLQLQKLIAAMTALLNSAAKSEILVENAKKPIRH